jgi:NAD(P)-dependent dehydrogenase (short-subunit alcohol dehydrogenase family)
LLTAALKKGDVAIATCKNDTTRLSDLERAGAITLELDISATPEVVQGFVKKVLELPLVKSNGGVNILVNNAGYAPMGAAEEIT